MQMESGPGDASNTISAMHKRHIPRLAELITTASCKHTCRHCIYPVDYAIHNKALSIKQWIDILYYVYHSLGIRKFVFSGRGLHRDTFELIHYIKNQFSGVEVGLIADGRTLKPYCDQVAELAPDWVDISIDGQETEHDMQRNQQGAFSETIAALDALMAHERIPKINILTCLTTLNLKTIPEMVLQLNASHGIKNFFITPVSIVPGIRPNQDLAPISQKFLWFLKEILEKIALLKDSWVEVEVFDLRYFKNICIENAAMLSFFKPRFDHMSLRSCIGDNLFGVNYYPESLTGVRELIVNTNGFVIPPMVMASGNIKPEYLFCNLVAARQWKGGFMPHCSPAALNFFSMKLIHEYDALHTLLAEL